MSPLHAPPADSPLDPIGLAIDLMGVDSTSGREGDLMDGVRRLLDARGWRTQLIPVTPGRDNVLATATAEPLVTLSTHLDTVPPYIPPTLDDWQLRGRGACDAKGIAAAMICAAERLRARDIPIALLFVVGEEVTHDGAHAANAVPTTSRAIINGEPTESTVALGTKGAIRLILRTSGEAAHSAYPHLGHSAIDTLVSLLHELRTLDLPTDPLLGDTTINVGRLSGGVADNVLAPWAEARVMVRLVSPPQEMVTRLREWLGDRGTWEVGPAVPPMKLAGVPGFRTSVAAFATDIPALVNWGTPYLFGPGSVHVAHRDDEFVDIAELRDAVNAYERLVMYALQLSR